MMITVVLQFSPSFVALPSAFEVDRSGDELGELEAMLSGEHRGSSYGTGGIQPVSSSQPLQALLGPSYDPPYKSIFQNDTYFGAFIQQLYGAPIPQINQTWSEVYLNGTLHLSISGNKAKKTNNHFIKPILIEEPDF